MCLFAYIHYLLYFQDYSLIMNQNIKNESHYLLGIVLSERDKKKAFSRVKNQFSYPGLCILSEKLEKISSSFDKFIYGNPIPNNLESIGASHKNYRTDELKTEIDWCLISFRKYKTEIKLFLNYKEEFEKCFLLGDYNQAKKIVEKTNTEIGFSLWGIGAMFLTNEYLNKSVESKLLLSELNERNIDGVFTTSLADFISQRCERKLSAYKYDNDLYNSLNNIKSNINKSNKDYYLFQLNFFEIGEFTELKDIIGFDYCNSIIDRYITFRRLLFYTFSNGIEMEFISNRIVYIQKKLSDKYFDSFLSIYKQEIISDNYFDSNYLKIIDLFYTGLYEEVAKEIKKEILNNPSEFTYLNLYARSLIFQNKLFEPLFEEPCLVNTISENIYNICQHNSNPANAINGLYQTSKNLYHFDINYQLSFFIKKEQGVKSNPFYYYLSLRKNDPKFSEIFGDKIASSNSYLKFIRGKNSNVIAINYRENCINGDFESNGQVSSTKSKIDRAKYHFLKKEYEKSKELWSEILDENHSITPIYEASVNYIFKSLYELGKIDDCINLFVTSFIKNPFSVRKINTIDIHKSIKKARFKNIQLDINLPLFISIISNDENEKSIIIDFFCKKNDVKLPSELIEKNLNLDKQKFLLFLYLTCNNETLKHYRHINTTKNRLQERINICNYLVNADSTSKEKYLNELNLLTNELIIYEGTQKLDESKIYANDQAIINNELEEYEGLYNRYITISNIVLKDITFVWLKRNELRILDKKSEVDYSQNDVKFTDNALVDVFYQIFDEIRGKFLYSKFGIVAYLSTRIRHGVLLGELRPELEKNHLIFTKNTLKDKYDIDPYWQSNYNLGSQSKDKLHNAIIAFSEKIDILINSIIKENIQIKLDDENQNGWFDYEFEKSFLINYAIELSYEKNYKDFCKKILEILWQRTEINLEAIRFTLQDEIKARFIQTINDFEQQLTFDIGKQNLPEVFTRVLSCSTNIENKIDKISSWFKRSGTIKSDFKLNFLIEILFNSIPKRHINKKLNLTVTNEFQKVIKGEFYDHFADVLTIFIDNIFIHSIKDIIECKIELVTKENFLEIIIENDGVDKKSSLPTSQFGDIIQINSTKLFTEGKSGLSKAVKTIKDDLKNELNEVFIKSENGRFRATLLIYYNDLVV